MITADVAGALTLPTEEFGDSSGNSSGMIFHPASCLAHTTPGSLMLRVDVLVSINAFLDKRNYAIN
jgi:hypothetical protein